MKPEAYDCVNPPEFSQELAELTTNPDKKMDAGENIGN